MTKQSILRRDFLRFGAAAAGVTAMPQVRAAATAQFDKPVSALPNGRLLVAGFENARLRQRRSDADLLSTIVEISLPTRDVRAVGSQLRNLHDLVQTGAGGVGPIFAVGQDEPELIELYAPDLSERRRLAFSGVRFKGHALSYGDGVLVAAESLERPLDPGFLLMLDAAGNEIDRVATGALGPHEIISCGQHIVVSHYGSEPRTGPFVEGELYHSINPGISVLDGQSLKLKAFHALPHRGAVSHVASLADETVVAMQMNAVRAAALRDTDVVTMGLADDDEAILLPSELGPMGSYQVPLPLYVVDLSEGLKSSIERPAQEMRRGQSFCRDSQTGVVLATFPNSQTICLFQDGGDPVFQTTLSYGVADPRGCAALMGTGLFAISGNSDNVAIINGGSGELIDLIATPLEHHSHMRWLPGA